MRRLKANLLRRAHHAQTCRYSIEPPRPRINEQKPSSEPGHDELWMQPLPRIETCPTCTLIVKKEVMHRSPGRVCCPKTNQFRDVALGASTGATRGSRSSGGPHRRRTAAVRRRLWQPPPFAPAN